MKRHSNILAVYLVLMRENKILLLKRANTGYEDGNYSFVAGHVDAGEPFKTSMVREAEEEAGIKIAPEDLEVAHIMHRKSDDSERVDTFFIAKNWEGEPKNMEPHKCDDLSWFDMDSLPENIIPCVRTALENIQKNQFYSEYGWE